MSTLSSRESIRNSVSMRNHRAYIKAQKLYRSELSKAGPTCQIKIIDTVLHVVGNGCNDTSLASTCGEHRPITPWTSPSSEADDVHDTYCTHLGML